MPAIRSAALVALVASATFAAACASDAPTAPAARPSPTVVGDEAVPGVAVAKAEARPERTPADADLAAVRAATARYHRVAVAVADGFESTVQCVAIEGAGMGVHYVNGARIGDGVLDPTRPEVLVYEPQADGTDRLVAVEYMIPRAMWDATHPGTRPTLFGAEFEDGPMDSYALHLWVWRHNAAGTFAPFNPRVGCPVSAGAADHAGHR